MARDRERKPRVYTAEQLLALGEDDFRFVVDRDLRGRGDPNMHKALRSPGVIDRTYNTCLRILKSIEGQFAAKNADADSSRAQFAKRRRALRVEVLEAQQQLERLGDVVGVPCDQCGRDSEGDPEEVEGLREAIRTARLELVKLDQQQANAAAQDAEWRAGAIRFKTGLEEDLVRLRDIRDSYRDRLYDTVVTEERDRLAATCRRYQQAIRGHHEHTRTDECDENGCAADKDLWATLGIAEDAETAAV